jgi:hypothetical protein
MRALDAVSDGRSETVAATTSVPAIARGLLGTTETVDVITNRIYAVVGTMPSVHNDADAADPRPLICCTQSSTPWRKKHGCLIQKTGQPKKLVR